jgi:hypothetical protein
MSLTPLGLYAEISAKTLSCEWIYQAVLLWGPERKAV